MNFLLYSSTQVPDASSNGIANALERLGHGVSRWQRHGEVFPIIGISQCMALYKIDVVVFFGGPEIDPVNVSMLRDNYPHAVYIMWNFDVMTVPDTWAWFEPLASKCDLAIQMDNSEKERWEAAGIRRLWCPMGIDPAVEKPYTGEFTQADRDKYTADVAFLGMPYEFGGRRELLDKVRDWCVARGKTFKIWGMWTEYLIGDELAKMIALTKVHLGHEPLDRPHVDHWSQRVYTVLAHGGFYVGQHVTGYDQQFWADRHLTFWRSEPGLFDALEWSLDESNRNVLDTISNRGSEFVRTECTWDARVKSVLSVIHSLMEARR